jgi:phage/plasmid primase-like uncharacterized protein
VAGAASIADNLGGWRQGDNWRCPCPLECGYTLSLRDGDDGRLLAYCFGGCEYNDILAVLIEYGLLDDDDGVVPRCGERVPVRSVEQDAHRIAHAHHVYAEANGGSLVATYLREARGISLLPPDILKEHSRCPHRLGVCLPAMVAPVVNVNGELRAVHCTYLRRDGSGKADLGKEFQRECRGVIRGGAIRLAVHDPDCELIIGEGVETVLSAMEIFGLPGWSVVYAGGLRTIELPSAVRNILIAADNDASGAGQRNAVAAARGWIAEGRAVRIVLPRATGDDFNNVLSRRRENGYSSREIRASRFPAPTRPAAQRDQRPVTAGQHPQQPAAKDGPRSLSPRS